MVCCTLGRKLCPWWACWCPRWPAGGEQAVTDLAKFYQDKIVDYVDLYQSGAALDIDHINSILCVTFHLRYCSLAL